MFRWPDRLRVYIGRIRKLSLALVGSSFASFTRHECTPTRYRADNHKQRLLPFCGGMTHSTRSGGSSEHLVVSAVDRILCGDRARTRGMACRLCEPDILSRTSRAGSGPSTLILPIGRDRAFEDTSVSRSIDDQNLVVIDLEFDDAEDAGALLAKMERIWQGPGKDVMQNPVAWVVETVETIDF